MPPSFSLSRRLQVSLRTAADLLSLVSQVKSYAQRSAKQDWDVSTFISPTRSDADQMEIVIRLTRKSPTAQDGSRSKLTEPDPRTSFC